MIRVKCKHCNKEIDDSMDIYYRKGDCIFFCSRNCAGEDYLVKVDAPNVREVDKFALFKDGKVYYSNIEDDHCYKCGDGVFIFSKMIKKDDVDYEIYICNKCGEQLEIKCD